MGVCSVSKVWLQQFYSSSSVKTSSNAAVKAQKRSSTWNKATVLHVTNTLTVLHKCTVTQLHPTASRHTASSVGKHNLPERTSIRGRLAPLFKARNPRCCSLLILFLQRLLVCPPGSAVCFSRIGEPKLMLLCMKVSSHPSFSFYYKLMSGSLVDDESGKPGNVKFKEL